MRYDYERFDSIMAALKVVEPSASLDLKFREALGEAIARKSEETIFEKGLRRLGEGIATLRAVIVPEPLVMVRVAASFIIVISAGLYIYSSQPSFPTVMAKDGPVMVQGVRDTVAREIDRQYKFKVGDTVTASSGAQVDIGLSNKYELRLKEGSTLKIAKLTPRFGNGKADFQLVGGRILVSVEPGFKGSKFVVDTSNATAVALGTKFAVDASGDKEPRTEVSVLQGKVKVRSRHAPEKMLIAKQFVMVGMGQKTDVYADRIPTPPQRLIEEEWAQLEELYQLGKKPQVMLLVKNAPDRTLQLLKPCPIYISDEKPREIPKLLEEALLKTAEAIKTNDSAKHLASIRLLERIIREYPNPKYDVQLMLYIGAYYEYLSYHKNAIRIFEEEIHKYPDSPLTSMAQCAIGIIYEEKLKNKAQADKAYKAVLNKYPNSLEAIWLEEKLGIKKVS